MNTFETLPQFSFSEQLFVAAFNGNIADTVRRIRDKGYILSEGLAQRYAKDPKILDAIKGRGSFVDLIAQKELVQVWLTNTFSDHTVDMTNRLKALKLLGDSLGMFVQKIETTDKTHERWLERIWAEEKKENNVPANDQSEQPAKFKLSIFE